jgi:hypothetical protein
MPKDVRLLPSRKSSEQFVHILRQHFVAFLFVLDYSEVFFSAVQAHKTFSQGNRKLVAKVSTPSSAIGQQ